MNDIKELKGKLLTSVAKVCDRHIIFSCSDGTEYSMSDPEDWGSSVKIEDITDDWMNILTGEIVMDAYESNSQDLGPANGLDSSYTWTFYRIITQRGAVVIRWYGTSNGYYSEKAQFSQTK